jgi:Protein kinase domain/Cyclic nucleotide-binding domain
MLIVCHNKRHDCVSHYVILSPPLKVGLDIIKNSLEPRDISALVGCIKDQTYKKGAVIVQRGKVVPAALYLVRSGEVEVKFADGGTTIFQEGGCFGEDQIKADQVLQGKGDPVVTANYTVTVIEDCTIGVLTLEESRLVVDTRKFGTGEKPAPAVVTPSIAQKDLKKHKILGAGTFGQVWLVSNESGGKRSAYALKIQSKYDLIQNNQAKGVVNEKNIMAQLSHPFIIRLVNTYQDPQRVYMLLGLVQGGELYSVLHTPRRDGVPEKQAKFYAAGIIEGLTYMHNKHIVYRDLKVLISTSNVFFYDIVCEC